MKILKLIALTATIFSYSLSGFAKTLVISDIDDTIKKANTMGGIGGIYHFLRKKPYAEARDLFNEIKLNEKASGEEISYYYVSAAPSYTFNGEEWIYKNNFPSGPIYLKTRDNGGNTYDYKYRTIKAIIEKESIRNADLKILFFGDNSQHDAKVYYDLRKAMSLNAAIYIRDVSTEATYFDSTLPVKKLDNVEYFFSERELVDHSDFAFMSEKLKKLIKTQYERGDLVPEYTFDTLEDRLEDLCKAKFAAISCKTEAKTLATKYWQDYHSRF